MRKPLTDMQQQALDFITENDPRLSTVRAYSDAAGFPSHQAFVSSLLSLYMKGYLVVDPKYTEERKDGG